MTSPSPAPSPEALLERFRRHGEPGTFGALFDRTAPELFRVAVALTQDPAAAEDAVQETYVAALRLLPRFEAGRPVLPWLVALLQRRLQHARRSASRRRARLHVLAGRGGGAADVPAADVCEREDRDASLHAALDGLAEPYRGVAILRWRHGLEPAEIAHVRSEPPGTTRSLLSRALERLRARWKGALPAVLVPPRAPLGLDAVRTAVLHEAARLGGPASGVAALTTAVALGHGTALLVTACVLAIGVGAALLPWPTSTSTPVADPHGLGHAPIASAPPVELTGRPPPLSHARAADATVTGVGTPAQTAATVDEAGEIPGERVALDVEVVDHRGHAVPLALLKAMWGEWHQDLGRTDAEGRGTFQVPRGTRALEVWGASPADPRRFLFVHYHALAGGETATRVVLRTGADVVGRLVAADGTPLALANVRLVPQPWGFGPMRTDEQGRFRLPAVEGEEVEVRFDGLDHSPGAGDFAQPLAGNDLLRAGLAHVVPGDAEVELVAAPVATDAGLEVRVLAPDGEPEPDALVVAHLGNGLRNTLARTDADGRVFFRGLPRWPCSLSVSPATFEGQRRLWRPVILDDVRPGGAPVEVRLTLAAALRGRVLDAAGKPVVGAWCAAMRGAEYAACFPSGPDGRFDVCSNVPPGTRLQVSARWPMHEPRTRGVVECVIAGEDAGELTIVLTEFAQPTSPTDAQAPAPPRHR